MALTAAHCAKTLVIASAIGSPSLQQCSRLLLPGMIECIAKIAALEGESTGMRTQIVAEIWRAFAALFSSSSEENREDPCLIFYVPYLMLVVRSAVIGGPFAHNDFTHGPNPNAIIVAAYTNHYASVNLCHNVSTSFQRGNY